MKTLTELRAGLKELGTLGIINSILKNTNYTKKAVVYGDEMYFGMKNEKGASNLYKKLSDWVGDEISGIGYGKTRQTDAAIIGEDVVAYISIEFNKAPTAKFISAAKAKVMTDSEYRKNHREIVGK